MSYWGHGELERQAGCCVAEVLLVLLCEDLIVVVGRPAVSCHERIHPCVLAVGILSSCGPKKVDDMPLRVQLDASVKLRDSRVERGNAVDRWLGLSSSWKWEVAVCLLELRAATDYATRQLHGRGRYVPLHYPNL